MISTVPSIRRPGPRPRLSREAIVDSAVRLMDREGHEALSFRAVARELGIAAGALSNYFPNLAALKDHVAAKVLSSLPPLEPRKDIRKQLQQFGMSLMEITQAHPYLANMHGPESAAVVTRMMARSVKVLMKAGLDGERAVAVFTIVSSLAHAWGVRDAIPRSPEMLASSEAAAREEFEGGFPALPRNVVGMNPTELYRRWFLLSIDGLLL